MTTTRTLTATTRYRAGWLTAMAAASAEGDRARAVPDTWSPEAREARESRKRASKASCPRCSSDTWDGVGCDACGYYVSALTA